MKEKTSKLFLMIAVVLACTFFCKTNTYAFQIRTTAPTSGGTGGQYYYTNVNPFTASGYGLPNCTAYVWGRAFEASGSRPNLSLGNADSFWSYNINNNVYSYGTQPKAGAIACYGGSSCHVQFVEKVENGVVYISESNWDARYNANIPSFWYGPMNESINNFQLSSLQGYIYICPEETTYTLDINGYLDSFPNELAGNTLVNIATFDVSINGNKVADDVNDYCNTLTKGSTYVISDIKPRTGTHYVRTLAGGGELTGTINSGVNVWLYFETNKVSLNYCGGSLSTNTFKVPGEAKYSFTAPTGEVLSKKVNKDVYKYYHYHNNYDGANYMYDSVAWTGNWDYCDKFSFERLGTTVTGLHDQGGKTYYQRLDECGKAIYGYVWFEDIVSKEVYEYRELKSATITNTVTAKDNIIPYLPTPTRSNYTFIEYNTRADGKGVGYNPGYLVTLSGNVDTLYAIWEAVGCQHQNKTKSNKYLKSSATCTSPAVYYYECSSCHNKLATTYTYGTALGHKETTTKTTATVSRDGSIVKSCSRCKKELSRTKIGRAYVAVSNKAIYTGKAIKQTVIVVDAKGNTISNSNYSISYKNNTKVGKATATVTFKNNYSGTNNYNFEIVPKATSIVSVNATTKALTVTWKQVSTDFMGYQIQYATSSDFKSGAKTATIKSKTTTSKKINSLKSGKTYYVRIRTYKTVGGKNYYSDWSKAKKVKVK